MRAESLTRLFSPVPISFGPVALVAATLAKQTQAF